MMTFVFSSTDDPQVPQPAKPEERSPEDTHRVYLARNKIDLTRDGALEALQALDAKKAPAKSYESLAKKYAVKFDGDFKPTTAGDHNHALGILRQRNEGDKALLSIQTGADVHYESPPRLSTGNLTLDWITSGGVPRGMVTQFKGAESLGKTFCALKTVAKCTQMGGSVLWAAAERFNKSWARLLGVAIPYSKEEMDRGKFTPEQREACALYNKLHPEGTRFSLVVGRTGNDVLQTLVDAIDLNAWDLIILDSIAVLRKTLNLDKKTVGDATRGGEAILFNDFCTRLESSFNAVEARRGRVIETQYRHVPTGTVATKLKELTSKKYKRKDIKTEKKVGQPLRAALLVINQIRDRGLDGYSMPPDAPGGRGLRHAKGLELDFGSSEKLWTQTADNRPVSYGRRTIVQCSKSKVGPPERNGPVEMHYETVHGVSQQGEFSLWTDMFGCQFKGDKKLAGLAEIAGFLVQRGAYFYMGDHQFHGRGGLESFLQNPDNIDVVRVLESQVRTWIRNDSL